MKSILFIFSCIIFILTCGFIPPKNTEGFFSTERESINPFSTKKSSKKLK